MMDFSILKNELGEMLNDIEELQEKKVAYESEIRKIDDAKFKRVIDAFKEMESIAKVYGFSSTMLFNSHMQIDGYYIHLGLYTSGDGTLELKAYRSVEKEYRHARDNDFIQWITLMPSYAKTCKENGTKAYVQEIIQKLQNEWETLEPGLSEGFSSTLKYYMNQKLHETANSTNSVLSQLKRKQAEV